jgi:NAD(P)-dependent dehydrogenase (short-subunit alcohol dehydrogenase family)
VESLAGKVAVVTGAASGIGLALATRFAQAGMRIVLSDVERPALERAADGLRAEGYDVLAQATDVSIEAEVEQLAAATLDHFGGAHVVCNNAGVGSRGLTVGDLPLRDFEWVLGVNLWGVIYGIRAFLPHLRLQDEGHIVNTASISGLYYLPRMGPYNASKAAVIALSETLQFELDAERSKVGVSVLCPGFVQTSISTAVRNLPERLTYELTTEQVAEMTEYKARRRAQASTGMEPAAVADLVVDSILQRRFYVFTHPETVEVMRQRFDRIVSGTNPQAPPA